MTYKRYYLIFIFIFFNTTYSNAQYEFTIDPSVQNHMISPYIYGLSYKIYPYAKATSLNSSRMTTFNWETNVSNGGAYQNNENDFFLPWITNIDSTNYTIPGVTVYDFQIRCQQNNLFSTIVLPNTDYVAKDTTCHQSMTAPSDCWISLKSNSPNSLTYPPDLSNDVVYTDELIQYLVNNFGTTGVDGYFLDNEPGIWYADYPHLVDLQIDSTNQNNLRYDSILQKSIRLAKTIKRINPNALVFGPSLWGYSSHVNLSGAPDAANHSSFSSFTDYYLNQFRQAEQTSNMNLLDVYDMHWYPDSIIRTDNTTAEVSYNRVMHPRTLWDPSYVDPGWQSYFGTMQILRKLKTSINNYNPNKKISVSEYFYGAPYHISGGIAQADVLGILGREDVFYASLFWPKWSHEINKDSLDGYVKSAFDIYLNYDDNGSAFGSKSIAASTDDEVKSSIYASIDTSNNNLHIILINKSFDESVSSKININNYNTKQQYRMYFFDQTNEEIQRTISQIPNINDFSITLPPYSVSHLIFESTEGAATNNTSYENMVEIYPNPIIDNEVNIINKTEKSINKIDLIDMNGRVVLEINDLKGQFVLSDIPKGFFIMRLTIGNTMIYRKITNL